jgi:hypothetical protein
VQAGLVGVFLGAALAVLGVGQVPVEVLPAVVPLVFDVRRSRLTASQEYVLAQLVLQPEVQAGPLPVSELYDRLPAEVRDDLSRVDFEDFLDACRRAGGAPGRRQDGADVPRPGAVPHHLPLRTCHRRFVLVTVARRVKAQLGFENCDARRAGRKSWAGRW